MKKILFSFAAFAVFLLAQAVYAQDIPHVTRISGEARNNLVRLTWIDSPVARGNVYIYRSARPFSGSIPANIRPITVRYGMQYYIDDIEDLDNLYYFIAASDASGNIYDVIIPQVNSISINLREPFASVVQIPPALSEPAPAVFEQPQTADMGGIFNLSARLDTQGVIISFASSYPGKNAILYRSMQPILEPADLLGAIIVHPAASSPFYDFPVPGIPWFYAVIYEDDILSGNLELKNGINTTLSAVTVHNEETASPFIRPIPLPVLSTAGSLSRISEPAPLSDEVLLYVNGIRGASAPLELKNPRVYAIDLETPSTGEETSLFRIISEHFVQHDWEGARAGLHNFLSLSRTQDLEMRARFYLGQVFYFSGYYREALFEFLQYRNFNPDEANDWIDAVLLAMVY